MEGELSAERMRQEQTRERIAHFIEQGLEPKEASRLAELMHAQEHGSLSPSEQSEREAFMKKLAEPKRGEGAA